MRLSKSGGGDTEAEKSRQDDEARLARMVTIQNVVGFFIACGLIRAGPWISQQLS